VSRSSVTRRRFIASVAAALAAPRIGRAQRPARDVLYNGITPAAPWPPDDRTLAASPRTPPYLIDPPAVIDIAIGRQLFVDDFLIEESTLARTFHQAAYHPASPVLTPAHDWEMRDEYAEVTGTPPSKAAMVFSDGVFFDPADRLFKMWYMGGYQQYTCFARSTDGIEWQRPLLSIVPRTNIVSPHPRDSSTVWLDLDAAKVTERYKLASYDLKQRRMRLQLSADGLHWRDAAMSGPCGDRSTFFYNPFRRKWIFSLRDEADGVGAFRRYFETDTFTRAQWAAGEPVRWARADTLDPRRPEYNVPTTLYNLDAVAYESVLLGLFTIFRGERQEREKPNDICLGFSRDGFHWSRDERRAFVSVSERQGDWNWSNVQSAGGGCLIVGDQLYFYVSGRSGVPGTNAPGLCSTGLATLRRDGFASLTDRKEPGVPTRVWPGRAAEVITRPVRFTGRFTFVNADVSGQLAAEVLDQNGKVVPGFALADCEPIRTSGTRMPLGWRGRSSLESLAGTPVRFRFVLNDARLFAFWVSPSMCGESNGYVAAGGPGFTGSIDR
jgi:hypothetical protein